MLVSIGVRFPVYSLISPCQTGSLVVSHISSAVATWSTLIVLLSIHLAMNHAAVRAVSMHSLNRQRANIVLSNYLDHDKVLTPEEVSKEERIFEWDGVFRWRGSHALAKAKIGVPLQSLLISLSAGHRVTGSIRDAKVQLKNLATAYREEQYLLWYDGVQQTAYIVLKEEVSPASQLKAWTHGLWIAHRLDGKYAISAKTKDDSTAMLKLIESTLVDLSKRWIECLERLKAAGWDIEIANLETASGTRLRLNAGIPHAGQSLQRHIGD